MARRQFGLVSLPAPTAPTAPTADPNDPAFTLVGYVRDKLMTGETIDVGAIAAELGMERDRVRHAVGNVRLGKNGLDVERVGKLGEGKYRLGKKARVGRAGRGGGKTVAPVRMGDLDEAADTAIERWSDEATAMDDAGISPRGRRKVKATEAPMLGSRLKVVALALERGDVVVRLEGDGEVWTAVLRK